MIKYTELSTLVIAATNLSATRKLIGLLERRPLVPCTLHIGVDYVSINADEVMALLRRNETLYITELTDAGIDTLDPPVDPNIRQRRKFLKKHVVPVIDDDDNDVEE